MDVPIEATVRFTDRELEALAGLLDAGVRATGLRAVKDAAALLEKMEAAQLAQSESADCKPPTHCDQAL